MINADKQLDVNLATSQVGDGYESPRGHVHDLNLVYQPSWARFLPGPSPGFRLRGLSPTLMHSGVISCGCCVMMLSGFNHAVMGGVSAQPSYLKRVSLNDGTSHSQLLVGTINAVYYVGVVVGAIIIASVSDRIGRRKACVCSGLVGIVAVGVVCSLQNFSWALWARFFNGLATGSFDAVGLNWTAETAKSKRRGLAFGLLMSCAAFGASKSYFIIFGLSRHMTGEFVWRFTLAFQAVYMLIILVAAFLLPESPRWLVLAGHYEEARSVLTDLSGPGGLSEAEHQAAIDGELSAIHSALEEERAHSASTSYLQMLFTNDHYSTARRTWTALFVQFACQLMIGAGLVATYGISIFQAGGWSAETASLLAGVSIITQAVFGLPGALLADVVGRRPAMIGGALLSSIILAFIGMCGHFVDANARAEQQDISKTRTYASATVALVLLWSAQFGMNWLWAPFVYPSEIFPAPSRAKGSAFGVIGFGLGAFTTNMIGPYLFAAIGYKALFLFCALSFLVSIVCFFFMPETANESLENIDTLFEKKTG